MVPKVSGITVRSYWRSNPVVPAERLQGAAVFAAFSNQQRLLELWKRDITVHSGGVSYPLLRLRHVHSFVNSLGRGMRLQFSRPTAPWLEPLLFCCWADEDISQSVECRKLIEAVTVGYPQYPVELVVEQIANA